MSFTGRLGQVDSYLANIRLGYWAAIPPSGLAGASHGVATVSGALNVYGPVALAGTSAGVATVSGSLGLTYGRQIRLTQEVVESDVLQTDRVRYLHQEVVESDVLQTDRIRYLYQLVIEVDGYDWVPPIGRILSGQFV